MKRRIYYLRGHVTVTAVNFANRQIKDIAAISRVKQASMAH